MIHICGSIKSEKFDDIKVLHLVLVAGPPPKLFYSYDAGAKYIHFSLSVRLLKRNPCNYTIHTYVFEGETNVFKMEMKHLTQVNTTLLSY